MVAVAASGDGVGDAEGGTGAVVAKGDAVGVSSFCSAVSSGVGCSVAGLLLCGVSVAVGVAVGETEKVMS